MSFVFFLNSLIFSCLKFSFWPILKNFDAVVKIWWYKYSRGLFFNAILSNTFSVFPFGSRNISPFSDPFFL